jgi:hypothetical protein
MIDHPQHPSAHDDLANAVCGAFVMLERDRRPQLISVADVIGVDGTPPPLPRSQYVFAAVWASGADIAVVYGASSSWSKELFVADFEAVLYHGSFFADLAMYRDNLDGKAATVRMVILAVAAGVMIVAARR